ncbi:MAG: heavy metal-responsive transcriptional regulator [Cyanobacteriota bacterium]|nr:heavy metal-responsive transcriptional regulator [Cyanobacteriota bacterium]
MTTTTLFKIGDIAKQTGVSVGTLRYYETEKLLHPAERGENGYRYYGTETLEQVQFIKKAQSLGFSLEEIRHILEVRFSGEKPCELVQDLLAEKINQLENQIQQMTIFKTELEEYRELWGKTPDDQEFSREICPLVASVPLKASIESLTPVFQSI